MFLTKIIDSNIKLQKSFDSKVKVSGIATDSREIRKGMIFAVIRGNKNNGKQYIKDAYKSGAKALLCEREHLKDIKTEVKNILVSKNIRLSVAVIAKKFYPKQPANISVVTGTNGKTSIVNFLYEIWKKNHIRGACFGTLGIKYDGKNKKTKLTTLDAIRLHKELNFIKSKKINFAAMEASSHALDQFRLDKVYVKFALFTNLSRDHLDYHQNMKKYFLSKIRLFKFILDKKGTAIINTDNRYGKKIKNICDIENIKNITYGFKKDSDWRITKVKREGKLTKVVFSKENIVYNFFCNLIADYEVENLIGAIIIANLNGMSLEKILKNIKSIKKPSGRLKKISKKNVRLSIFIDYAHTPEALEKSLKALKSVYDFKGNLILVFGCGGERDKGKRKFMGIVADNFADKVFITDDNPRYENAKNIRKEIASACKKAVCIPNRETAISRAINIMQENDILLIAGKGHEKYQEIKGSKIPFDDEVVVKEAINRKLA